MKSTKKKLSPSKNTSHSKSKKNASKVMKKLQDAIKSKILQKAEETSDDSEKPDKPSKKTSDIELNFFYTSDKFINSMDDDEIIKYICNKYPDFMKLGCKDIEIKKHIIQMIQDKEFITGLLEYFNFTLFDFFQFLFRLDTSIFKGPFLNKVTRLIKEKNYKI